jgi:hypothetical protein
METYLTKQMKQLLESRSEHRLSPAVSYYSSVCPVDCRDSAPIRP